MICRTLNIATRGRLSCTPKTRVTTGLICCNITVINPPIVEKLSVKKSYKGTKNYKIIYKTKNPDEITWERLYREDEDILTIIKIFMKCQ